MLAPGNFSVFVQGDRPSQGYQGILSSGLRKRQNCFPALGLGTFGTRWLFSRLERTALVGVGLFGLDSLGLPFKLSLKQFPIEVGEHRPPKNPCWSWVQGVDRSIVGSFEDVRSSWWSPRDFCQPLGLIIEGSDWSSKLYRSLEECIEFINRSLLICCGWH